MSYKINVRFYQFDTSTYFHLVEKTVWNFANGGTWDECQGEQVLTMGGSGTSGCLRFKSDKGEQIIFALGVHDYKPWCDTVADLNGETGMTVHAQYYNDGRGYQREKQLTEWSCKSSASGRKYTVKYTVASASATFVCNLLSATEHRDGSLCRRLLECRK